MRWELRRDPVRWSAVAVGRQGARGWWVQEVVALAHRSGACPLEQGREDADGWAPAIVTGGMGHYHVGPGHSGGV
jgi:hypothetical protein